jgi:hypothetical protein
MTSALPSIVEQRRFKSPAVTPQALAWHNGALWMGSRDVRHMYGIEPNQWKVFEEREAPGIPWAAVSVNGSLRVTIGEGANDDRYMWSYKPGTGFSDQGRFAYPDFTGSYLSYDGSNIFLSQWYKGLLLKLTSTGEVIGQIKVEGEVSGHVFANGMLYVLHGTEQNGESWTISKLDPKQENPMVEDIATVPFACRSLTFDDVNFWSNFRAAGETIAFTLPE